MNLPDDQDAGNGGSTANGGSAGHGLGGQGGMRDAAVDSINNTGGMSVPVDARSDVSRPDGTTDTPVSNDADPDVRPLVDAMARMCNLPNGGFRACLVNLADGCNANGDCLCGSNSECSPETADRCASGNCLCGDEDACNGSRECINGECIKL